MPFNFITFRANTSFRSYGSWLLLAALDAVWPANRPECLTARCATPLHGTSAIFASRSGLAALRRFFLASLGPVPRFTFKRAPLRLRRAMLLRSGIPYCRTRAQRLLLLTGMERSHASVFYAPTRLPLCLLARSTAFVSPLFFVRHAA